MRPRLRTESSPSRPRDGSVVQLNGVRRTQRDPGVSSDPDRVRRRRRRIRDERPEREGRPERDPRRDRGPGRGTRSSRSSGGGSGRPPAQARTSGGFWAWLKRLFAGPERPALPGLTADETRAVESFSKHLGIQFNDPKLLRLALTHRSYLHVQRATTREMRAQSVQGALPIPHGDRPLPDILEDLERQLIERAYEKANKVKTETARLLGIKTSALYYKLEKYGFIQKGEKPSDE